MRLTKHRYQPQRTQRGVAAAKLKFELRYPVAPKAPLLPGEVPDEA